MKKYWIKKPLSAAVSIATAAVLLSGCQQYFSRHEGVSSFAGETNAHNQAISVVDTWPDGFDNTSIETDGQRQAAAVERYKNPPKEDTGSKSAALKIVAP